MTPPVVREFTLLGHPVGHSLSPAIHRAAFEALGIEAVYRTLDVEADALESAMTRAASRGGGNVTLPHKRRAAALLDVASPLVRATGACNCFWIREGGGLEGENTDVAGFHAAARALMEETWPARRVLLLGAGGAAAAVLVGCLRAGVGSVDVLDRTPERARAMTTTVGRGDAAVRVLEPRRSSLPAAGSGPSDRRAALALPRGAAAGRYDLVVNATSVGLEAADPLPVALEGMEAAVLDLVYGRDETAWIRAARARGLPAADGLAMLVEQAAASLVCWLGVEPPRRAMLEAAGRAAGRAR